MHIYWWEASSCCYLAQQEVKKSDWSAVNAIEFPLITMFFDWSFPSQMFSKELSPRITNGFGKRSI